MTEPVCRSSPAPEIWSSQTVAFPGMRLREEKRDHRESFYGRADRRRVERSANRSTREEPLPLDWDQRRNVLLQEGEVRGLDVSETPQEENGRLKKCHCQLKI